MRNSVAVMLGTICYMEGDFTGAMRYYEDALERDKRVNGTNAVPISATRMAWVYQAQGKLRAAEKLVRTGGLYPRARQPAVLHRRRAQLAAGGNSAGVEPYRRSRSPRSAKDWLC